MARGNFNSASSYFTSTTIPVFPFTVSGWAKVAGTSALVSVDDTGGSLDGLGVYYSSGSGLWAHELNNGLASGATAISSDPGTGVWFHFCGVFVGDSERYSYVNGGNKASNTTNNGSDQSLYDTLTVGGRNLSGAEYFNGELAEVGIWNVALSDAEISSLGKGFACPHVRPGSLINHIPMVRGSQDVVGDLTETGTAGVASHPPIIGAIAV